VLASPRRIDCFDDPEAPKANSLVPSVNVVVVNDAGEILMIRRTDNGEVRQEFSIVLTAIAFPGVGGPEIQSLT
jgi:hypothetical protein